MTNLSSVLLVLLAISISLLLSACKSLIFPMAKPHTDETSQHNRQGGNSSHHRINSNYTWYPESQRSPSQQEREVLRLTNLARATARQCGSQHFAAAPALRWNKALGKVARNHAADMARRRYFSHSSPEGLGSRGRMQQLGLDPMSTGENIAAGYHSAAEVVADWLASPSHCRNIMSPKFGQMGAGAVSEAGNIYGIHWSQDFASN